ncbi:MFS transporter [Mycolicibacterium sp.]|uniref:MFS transporter n=1 Tax=Mycolicibacterium sp. TaxID=2320850 RepID=UPI003D0C8D08
MDTSTTFVEGISHGFAARARWAAAPLRRRVGFWLVAAVYLLAMLGGALPMPLYVFWSHDMGFGPFTTTLIFAVYALGVVVSLLVFAPMSDRGGRRPLLAVSLVVVAAGTAGFLLAHNVEMLLFARLLSGLAAGVVTATGTAALEDLAGPRSKARASMVATAANMGGLASGTVIAGVFAQFGGDPTRLVFWVYLASLAPALLAVAVTPETVASPRWQGVAIRRPAVPETTPSRRRFASAAAAVFAAFAVNGVFSSLMPSFLREQLHIGSVAVVGTLIGLLFAVGLAAQLAAPERVLHSRVIAPGLLVGGVAIFEIALWTQVLSVFVVGTVLAGAGVGLAFRHGVAATAELADPKRRANLFATYFLAGYAGAIVPTLALGVLDQTLHQNVATLILAVSVSVITIAAAALRPRTQPRKDDLS